MSMTAINRTTRVLHAIETRTWEHDRGTTTYWLMINLGDSETAIRRSLAKLLEGGFIERVKEGHEYKYRAVRK